MSAKNIIDRFGGQTALAKLIGKGQSTVGYWAKAGVIPAKWHGVLLDVAKRTGVPLSAQDFITDTATKPAFQTHSRSQPEVPSPASGPVDAYSSGSSPFLFYSGQDGSTKVQVMVGDETVWASQKGMAEIFDVETNTINYHLKEIFSSTELDEQTVIRIFRVTASDGKNYNTRFYNLDAIISVGYRVNSVHATRFRQWATKVLKSYLIKGFAMDDDRLKQGQALFGKDYFDELLEKIREIRASERRFYQKITDLYA